MGNVAFSEDNVKKGDGFVAVIDSGVGGITVLASLVSELPHEDFVYFGDSAYTPYGEKPQDWVYARTREIADGYIASGAKAVVIACNTATSVAAARLRSENPDIPIIGIEPALKPAACALAGGTILVMATPMTLRLEKFQQLADEWGAGCTVIPIACDGLAGAIEHGGADSPRVSALLEELIGKYRGKVDGVVLGCTHYPIAAHAIRRTLGDVPLFDGAAGTARQLANVLREHDLLNAAQGEGKIEFYSSSDEEGAPAAARALFDSYRNTIPACV